MIPLSVIQPKPCGDCTVCCTIMNVEELSKPAQVPCEHANKGCEIYETRPQSCRNFQCLWSNNFIEGDERRRPDKLGLMFNYGETKEVGGVVIAWEVWKDASTEPQALYVLQKLKRYKVLIVRYDGKHKMGEGLLNYVRTHQTR